MRFVLIALILATIGFAAPVPRPTKCRTCVRDRHGRIKRNPLAVHDFKRTHPCPVTGKRVGPCKGMVIDHIVPLKRDGADAPSNMQWQTKAAARAKDRVE